MTDGAGFADKVNGMALVRGLGHAGPLRLARFSADYR
jgi:hypothetical protein